MRRIRKIGVNLFAIINKLDSHSASHCESTSHSLVR